MTDNNKQIIVPVIYRSPSQNNSEFDSFLSNPEQFLRDICKCKSTVSVITGDFNPFNTSEGANLFPYILERVFAIN